MIDREELKRERDGLCLTEWSCGKLACAFSCSVGVRGQNLNQGMRAAGVVWRGQLAHSDQMLPQRGKK